MKQRVRGVFFLLALVMLLGGGYTALQVWRTNRALTALHEVAKSTDLDALLDGQQSDVADAVDLAMRGINLVKGEDGQETWRLHANWATLRQDSSLVEMRDPNIQYRLGDKDDADEPRYVVTTSSMGRVEDQNNLISMQGDVHAVSNEDVLEGPLAVFNNETRILEFPEGGTLTSPTLSGKASVLRWSMITNILEGENGVEVVWTPQPDLPLQPVGPDGPDVPDGSDAAPPADSSTGGSSTINSVSPTVSGIESTPDPAASRVAPHDPSEMPQ